MWTRGPLLVLLPGAAALAFDGALSPLRTVAYQLSHQLAGRIAVADDNIRPAIRSAVHHAREVGALTRASSVTLDELANTRIPSEDAELLAYVARPSAPDSSRPLPVLILLHEFFGLNEAIVGKARGVDSIAL